MLTGLLTRGSARAGLLLLAAIAAFSSPVGSLVGTASATPPPVQQTLLTAGLALPTQLASNAAGDVVVVDNHRVVWRFAAGDTVPTQLLDIPAEYPSGVALNAAGDVFVSD